MTPDEIAAAAIDKLGIELMERLNEPSAIGRAMIASGAGLLLSQKGPAETAQLLRDFAAHIEKKEN